MMRLECCSKMRRTKAIHAWQLAKVGLHGQYVNAKRVLDLSAGAELDAGRKFYFVLARTELAGQPCWQQEYCNDTIRQHRFRIFQHMTTC